MSLSSNLRNANVPLFVMLKSWLHMRTLLYTIAFYNEFYLNKRSMGFVRLGVYYLLREVH